MPLHIRHAIRSGRRLCANLGARAFQEVTLWVGEGDGVGWVLTALLTQTRSGHVAPRETA